MSGGKKRSGFQITSVTSDLNQTPTGQSAPSVVLTVLQTETSSCSPQRSSSQPTTPSLRRKYISHDALGQGAGSCSRFRVVRLAVGGAVNCGRRESYRRGRWTCTDFMEQLEGAGFRRVIENMRHAHSLESLDLIGRDRGRGGAQSQDTAQPIRGRQGTGLVLRSGPPSPTHQEPITIQPLNQRQPMGEQGLDSTPLPRLSRTQNIPPSLRLDVKTRGQPSSPPAGSYHPTLDQTIFSSVDDSTSSHSLVALDNRIEQVLDLVKSHLMLAVREEVELLRERIRELQEKNQHLERENHILRTLTHNIHTT
ncbi:TSC22 domain family protein 4 isoform X2 [Toxotes jaculatrix]|uniref:TSC22 domain family protein 4 isoform X2 n=1 Tax=Toxotes jaculatrix TaxID=941984 RepID=UPI001B3B15AF|nr:TSC22 domain family protein 4 isoform X2 [Toxotes jaculatrix]